jgi:signal transduction histidine kinase
MKFQFKSFQTRVARRIFLLFIICAILPIMGMAAASYFQVSRQLEDQHVERLRQQSRTVGMSIYERLLFLKTEMEVVAGRYPPGMSSGAPLLEIPKDGHSKRFISMAWEKYTGYGNPRPIQLVVNPPRTPNSSVRLTLKIFDKDARTQLVGTIQNAYLWEAATYLKEGTDVCIANQRGAILLPPATTDVAPLIRQLTVAESPQGGHLAWEKDGERFIAGYSSLFLEPNFYTVGWLVIMVEPGSRLVWLMEDYKTTFPAIIVFSLGLVFLLGQYLIRRNMGPIETLQEATDKIADGDFGHQVVIDSGDEFENLGQSFNDMSRKLKESQALLVRTARMGSMGQMASGIVHEVKQPLTAIFGLVQLVMMNVTDKKDKDSLETVLVAVEDLDKTLNRFRSFSQDSPLEMTRQDLAKAAAEVHRLLAIRFRKRKIGFVVNADENVPDVMGDKRSLQQVLSNLLVNALHALEDHPVESPEVEVRIRMAEGRVVMEIIDNGCGIPEEIQEKIFDPFFTTKSEDKGTGLGMAIVESIVHQHKGSIELISQPGAGTTVRLMFDPAD